MNVNCLNQIIFNHVFNKDERKSINSNDYDQSNRFQSVRETRFDWSKLFELKEEMST